ncbi:MAG: cobalamin B12-binding domain-containing protein [Elusimicrobia bacterium]|nr:cobalamin B12-binding domain-containing protein [Elusimicrobiota bacterium]
MKILLINPPNPDPPPSYYGPHYGLSLIGAVLEAAGHRVAGRDYDLWKREAVLAELPRLAASESPDLVGLSCLSSNRWTVMAMADAVKKASPKTTVVVGGPWATLEPGFVLGRCKADIVAVGDGEETALELVGALSDGRSLASVRGLAFRQAGAVRRTGARGPFQDVDSLPYPAFHLFDAAGQLEARSRPEAQALAGHISAAGRRCLAMHSALMVLGSRGCVYRCLFCPMSTFQGPVRRHSPSYFIGMVEHLCKTYAQKRMVFGDNYFTLDQDWAGEISDRLVRSKLGLQWICMTRPDAVSRSLLAKMGRAGCREIAYGLESGSPAVQKRIGKRMQLDRVGPALKDTRDAGISATLMLMVGNPGESTATVRETAGFCAGLEPDRVLVHTTKVYPGTALHALAEKQGVIPAGFYERDDHRAPPYTGERTLAELKAFKGLLQPRTTFLGAGAGCVNGCCELRRPGEGAPVLPKLLALASLRAERTVLGGGEPFLRKDAAELLAEALVLQMHGLWFYTTARPLAAPRQEKLWEALTASLRKDVARGVIVPLFSSDPARHDRATQVQGSLVQARAGMLRWRRAGGEVHAWLHLSKENVSGLAAWLAWTADHGVSKVSFLFGSSPPGWGTADWKDLPSMTEASQAVLKASAAAGALGIEVSSFGIPECLLSDDQVPSVENRRVFDEFLPPSGEPVSLRGLRCEKLKTKPSACKACGKAKLCEGVWRRYLRLHGSSEFHGL